MLGGVKSNSDSSPSRIEHDNPRPLQTFGDWGQ